MGLREWLKATRHGPTHHNTQSATIEEASRRPDQIGNLESDVARRTNAHLTPPKPHLPLQSRKDNSDAAHRSPWARKIILTLDGGGIRGYSSLLIIEELMRLIKDFESTEVPENSRTGTRWSGETLADYHPHSQYYAWGTEATCQTYEVKGSKARGGMDAQAVSGDAPQESLAIGDYKVHHYFDYVAGTSTGGLSAIMLSRLEMSIEDALQQYDIVGNTVFAHPRFHMEGFLRTKYKSANMDNALQQVICNAGRGPIVLLKNSNADACHTAAIASIDPDQEAYIFRSYDHLSPGSTVRKKLTGTHRNTGEAHSVDVLKVARATSAAPGYFKDVFVGQDKFVDGGLGANNPTRVIWKDIRQVHGMREPALVLSIGTGKPRRGARTGKANSMDYQFKKMIKTIKSLAKIVTESEETHEELAELYPFDEDDLYFASSLPHYVRLNTPEISTIELDEWLPRDSGTTTKDTLRSATYAYIDDGETWLTLAQCAHFLVRTRRARASSERWEKFATDLVYRCPEQTTCNVLNAFSRAELRQHSFEGHGHVWPVRLDQRLDTRADARQQCLIPPNHYLCIWDECGQKQPMVFGNPDDLLDHLRDDDRHKIAKPLLKSPDEIEEWLDKGRISRTELRKTDTERERETVARNKKEADVVGGQSALNGGASRAPKWPKAASHNSI